MCGIIGFNWEDKNLLNKCLNEIKHRGIDGTGKFLDKGISLGHQRLSIIDLSKSGKQPMSNEDNTIFIVFNGEIYNFKELRRQLEQKGYEFKSNTDTEVLIYLYEEEGFNFLNKLNGMFSFCIYDSRKKILFLARDRIGIKPLYYYKKESKFMFCSEIKGILQNKEILRNVNLNAVYSFLSFRANTTFETCFQNINKLPPGHYLIYDLKNNIFNIKKYWDLNFNEEKKSEKYYSDRLKFLLEDSVKKRLMSDVPYGAYLSGGVDSGTIVSMMNKYCSKSVETFSVGFEGEYDETNEAKFLSEKIGTHHHELIIQENSVKNLPGIIYSLDEPMADPTSLPIYLLSKFTKKYCTVILTGEGADEIFAGYPQYKFMKLHKFFLRPIPIFLRKPLINSFKLFSGKALNKGFEFASELGEKGMQRFSNFALSNNSPEQYLNMVSIFNEQEKRQLLNNKFPIDYYSSYKKYFKNSSLINNCLNLDFKESMVEDLLMKIDKNTMAFSIEGRVPFLDHRIVEFASKIPESLKLNFFNRDKYLLRKTVKNILPSQTRNRKKKHFFVPINKWFNNELLQLKQDLLSEKYLKKQKIFNPTYIKNIDKSYNSSKLFYARQLWSLISFQIWYKQFIENEKIKI